VLSEHETLELLEQLKLGILPGSAGSGGLEVDTVSHWPILVGGGMSLNLQSVAALELNCQPESICVTPTKTQSVCCTDLLANFERVHHLLAGVDGRKLVIAYDRDFSTMLSVLQSANYYSSKECFVSSEGRLPESNSDFYSRHSEFSQAIAISIDPGSSASGQPVELSFLALDDEVISFAGSWVLRLSHAGIESEIFIGLANSHFESLAVEPTPGSDTYSISVRTEKIGRSSGLNALVAELAEPEFLQLAKSQEIGSFAVGNSDNGIACIDGVTDEQKEISASTLLVQQMLRLSVDDLYLLLVEAVGAESVLTFRFEIDPLSLPESGQLLWDGCSHRCLSVNGLPVRCACLTVSDGKFLLKSHE